MIQDKQLEFSSAQNLAQAAGTYTSTNTVDLGARGPWGVGSAGEQDVDIVFTVDQTFTSGGAGTLQINLRTSPSSNMAGATIVQSSRVYALADLAAGANLDFQPQLGMALNRYIDVTYVVGGATMTAGQITARGTAARQMNR
jgi:hypothetical protein